MNFGGVLAISFLIVLLLVGSVVIILSPGETVSQKCVKVCAAAGYVYDDYNCVEYNLGGWCVDAECVCDVTKVVIK